MHPTINPNEDNHDCILFVRPKFSSKFLTSRKPIEESIKRGDIVSLINPKDPNEALCKRIIGLPGDLVKTYHYKKKYVLVPEGHCWVEGDNYAFSHDSNQLGCIPMGLILGNARFYCCRRRFFDLDRVVSELPSHRHLKEIKCKKELGVSHFFVDLKDKYDKDDDFESDEDNGDVCDEC